MKRKSLGFKTELLVKENPDEKIEIDYSTFPAIICE